MRHLSSLVVFGFICALSGCAADDPHLPRVDASAPNAAQLNGGRRLFASRCAACHRLPDPAKCDAGIMDSMSPQAGLKPDERAAVEAYVKAAVATRK